MTDRKPDDVYLAQWTCPLCGFDQRRTLLRPPCAACADQPVTTRPPAEQMSRYEALAREFLLKQQIICAPSPGEVCDRAARPCKCATAAAALAALLEAIALGGARELAAAREGRIRK